ncbi:hypothetical protein [Delftia sp. WSY_7]|uniref:hypothetical protein n=1 Tax=Delftia sp. WSY_7 TaxID=3367202 RepID=UPI00370CC985
MAYWQDLHGAETAVHNPATGVPHHEPVLRLLLDAVVFWPPWKQLFLRLADRQDKRSVIPIELADADQWLAGTVADASQLLHVAPVEVFQAGPVV